MYLYLSISYKYHQCIYSDYVALGILGWHDDERGHNSAALTNI